MNDTESYRPVRGALGSYYEYIFELCTELLYKHNIYLLNFLADLDRYFRFTVYIAANDQDHQSISIAYIVGCSGLTSVIMLWYWLIPAKAIHVNGL